MIIGKTVTVIFIILFLWMMLVITKPIKPKLEERFTLCDIRGLLSWEALGAESIKSSISGVNPSENNIKFFFKNFSSVQSIYCKKNISESILYRANSLNITYEINQPIELGLGLHRKGMGPFWQPITIESDSVNKKITSSFLLDRLYFPKSNWLSGAYEVVLFSVRKFDSNEPLILTIYNVYLE